MNKWYNQKGNQNEVVISGGVRISRNLEEYPFPSKLDTQGKEKVNGIIKNIIFENDDNFICFDMKDLTRAQTISLAERYLITPEFVSDNDGGSLIISSDESIGFMLCEEDHIRLQVMKSGLNLDEAYAQADKWDSIIDEKVKYAFDDRIGYMTACPANLGTAMRAFVIIHLPALTASGQISRLANTVSRLGLSITGAYGSRSQPSGDIYLISNQITLGITEATAISNLNSIVLQLVAQEKAAAASQIKEPEVEDEIYRALGILQNARLLSGNEFMKLISKVRMGCASGILDYPMEKIDSLIVDMQPATIVASNSDVSSVTQREAIRAEAVREALK